MATEITPRLEAYLKIQGSIAERMNEVLEVIKKIQPCTYEDIADELKTRTNLVTNRIHEMEKVGLIHVTGTTKQKGYTRSLFSICTEDEAKKFQKDFFTKYRTEKEDHETALQIVQNCPATKEIIKRRILYCKGKLRLLNKYAI